LNIVELEAVKMPLALYTIAAGKNPCGELMALVVGVVAKPGTKAPDGADGTAAKAATVSDRIDNKQITLFIALNT